MSTLQKMKKLDFLDLIRADDDSIDFALVWAVMMMYVLSAMVIFIGFMIWDFWCGVVGIAAGALGFVFHFIKVSSDGRVRSQRTQYVRSAERDGFDIDGGSC